MDVNRRQVKIIDAKEPSKKAIYAFFHGECRPIEGNRWEGKAFLRFLKGGPGWLPIRFERGTLEGVLDEMEDIIEKSPNLKPVRIVIEDIE